MRAMILAAGRGERFRPVTDTTPKPLIKLNNKALIQYHIEALVSAGFKEIVINHAWLGHKIEQYLGDGSRFGIEIAYSPEAQALETGGGIYQALPLLGDEPFLVINGDIYTDYDFSRLHTLEVSGLAHLVMVPNPDHNPAGDFVLQNNLILPEGQEKLTFSGMGVYHPEIFHECQPGKFPLAPLLRKAMSARQVSGEYFQGFWMDIGTQDRLQLAEQYSA